MSTTENNRVAMEVYKQTRDKIKAITVHNQRLDKSDPLIRLAENTPNNFIAFRKHETMNIDEAMRHEMSTRYTPHHTRKMKTNAIVALEMRVSAPPNWVRDEGQQPGEYNDERMRVWVDANLKKLKEVFGDKLIQVDVHLDEATPHFHAIIVPVEEYEKDGQKYSTFNARDLTKKAGPWGYSKLQDYMADAVEHLDIKRGLKGSKATSSKIKELHQAIEEAGENAPQFPTTLRQGKRKTHEKGKGPFKKTVEEDDASFFKRCYEELRKFYTKRMGEVNKKLKSAYEALAQVNYQLEQEKQRTALYQELASSPEDLKTQIDKVAERERYVQIREDNFEMREAALNELHQSEIDEKDKVINDLTEQNEWRKNKIRQLQNDPTLKS